MTPSRASADGSPGTPSILGTAAVEQGALLVTDAGHRGPRGEGNRAAPRGGCAVARERTELRDWRGRNSTRSTSSPIGCCASASTTARSPDRSTGPSARADLERVLAKLTEREPRACACRRNGPRSRGLCAARRALPEGVDDLPSLATYAPGAGIRRRPAERDGHVQRISRCTCSTSSFDCRDQGRLASYRSPSPSPRSSPAP